MNRTGPARVVALDLIRGVAVLGILAINIAGFAGPTVATLSPNLPETGSLADEVAFGIGFVLFEGKMRALFSLLFGASMLLFIERTDAAGRYGDLLQLRRLGWLMVFGLLHYFLLWWGDILFLYGLSGIIALFMRDLRLRPLIIIALTIFFGWHLAGAALTLPEVLREEHVRQGTATTEEMQASARESTEIAEGAARELDDYRSRFVKQLAVKLSHQTLQPLEIAIYSIGETLPLMLFGMALYRTGFFTGGWPLRRLKQAAWLGTGIGLVLTLAILAWVAPRHFPYQGMSAALLYWTAPPHLLMTIGYAAILVLAAPRIVATRIGQRLVAAGRMAFSNYIGTTVLMTAIFYGWGLGLAGSLGHAMQLPFILLGWVAMLLWSKPWLDRFGQGPLERAWRWLTAIRGSGSRL